MKLPFDIARARRAMDCASDAYDEATIASDPVFALIKFDPASGVMFVGFRGTTDVRGWLVDFDATMVKSPNGDFMVHRGFLQALAKVLPELVEAVRKYDPKEIVLCGHSLGGALAMMAALAFRAAGLWPSGVFTFGQPRVGDAGFARSYDLYFRAITWRFVNENDIVPRVPFVSLGYRHAGRCCFFPAGTPGEGTGPSPIIDPNLVQLIASDAIGIFTSLEDLKCEPLDDHHLPRYQARMNAIADSQSPIANGVAA